MIYTDYILKVIRLIIEISEQQEIIGYQQMYFVLLGLMVVC